MTVTPREAFLAAWPFSVEACVVGEEVDRALAIIDALGFVIVHKEESKMALHETTFGYLKPTDAQMGKMNTLRAAAQMYAHVLETHLTDGPDKTYLLRKLREVAMWANVSVTRHSTGAPRLDGPEPDEPNYPPSHPAPGDLGSVPL